MRECEAVYAKEGWYPFYDNNGRLHIHKPGRECWCGWPHISEDLLDEISDEDVKKIMEGRYL